MLAMALVATLGLVSDDSLPAEALGLPLIDLSAEPEARTVIDRVQGVYLGHPTTVLLEDGQTMLCVYPEGHGKGAIQLKRSADSGRTWSERLPVPKNWATSLETPTIHRAVDREGRKRLILFSGLYPIRMAHSEDDGATWTPLSPIGDYGGIVAMASVDRLNDGRYQAFFHDDGRFWTASGKAGRFRVYRVVSADAGLTWGTPREIASMEGLDLCEPGLVRSPDGRRCVLLLRENRRVGPSQWIASEDEGETWSAPRPLPLTLTGDRHVAKYAEDGRLVVTFRDMADGSPTRGDWVAWVGRFEELESGSPGAYRIRLADNKNAWDCGYSGLEVLPNGELVACSYGHWNKDQRPYVIAVRFRLRDRL